MKNIISLLTISLGVGCAGLAWSLDKEELAKRWRQLPTVPEAELPKMENKRGDLRGKLHTEGLQGHTWVSFPFIENPASFSFDRKGRLYVSEANRFWLGVPDLRGANFMVREDFQSLTVQDRLDMYERHKDNYPEGWFDSISDRIIRLEDSDGNLVADQRTLFSDHFNKPADGIGFSLLADEDNTVYFTCIPNVWKMTDKDDDGVADTHEAISEGYGVRVSFIGHDLHGITRGPDGMLYFSVGDRGYHVTTDDGEVLSGPGEGAIFRCEPDGSGLERYCRGLRNPQELVFDEWGNLFTFDNTGDIGDKARMVYALYGTDSGWDMSHQSPHHYAEILDWGDFRPDTAMWVVEKMYAPFNEEQPQWVYPPAANVSKGPSGITLVTGESVPDELRGKFLVTDYQGAATNSSTWVVAHQPKGAGYEPSEVSTLIDGVAASDVELGYDGRIYLCDFGGGWSINTNGSIQVLESTDAAQRSAGEKVAALFEEGFADRDNTELTLLMNSKDKRVRQAAQFALVEKEGGAETLAKIAKTADNLPARLHAVWGLGQLVRTSGHQTSKLVELLNDADPEVRANVVRVLGDCRVADAAELVLERLQKDDSARVRSLAAIALSRIAEPGDQQVIDALYQAAVDNGKGKEIDPVLRHAILSGLDTISTVAAAAERNRSKSEEERLTAVLYLRRHASPELTSFLDDPSLKVRREAVIAIYDTDAMDGPAGAVLASMGEHSSEFPATVQRRVAAANYRLGGIDNAQSLLTMAAADEIDSTVKKAALQGLLKWETEIVTDPVHGHYRPIPQKERSLASLGENMGSELEAFLAGDHAPELISLAMQLASDTGVELNADTLIAQAQKTTLDSTVRIAALNSLVKANPAKAKSVIQSLLDDSDAPVQAAALTQAYAQPDMVGSLGDRAFAAISGGPIPVARAAISGMAEHSPARWTAIWQIARDALRPELQLDGYLAAQRTAPELTQAFAASDPHAVFDLSELGGNVERGELVYNNQGACRQCHQIGKDGGMQGPNLTTVGSRLSPRQVLTSIYNPGLEIAKGYGTTSVILKNGEAVVGRLAKSDKKQVQVISPDGKERTVLRKDIATMTDPISAMPPLGAALPSHDLRDLVAYVSAQVKKSKKSTNDAEAHGDKKIAK